MKKLIGVVVAVSTLLLCATLAPPAKADAWNKRTIVTFREPVEVPGTVLQAGTYVFRMLDSLSNRHIVQIFNENETQVLATIQTVPNYRIERPDDSIFEFDERPGNAPQALKVWFFPGNTVGEEFIYGNY